jgi:hypothetical protein
MYSVSSILFFKSVYRKEKRQFSYLIFTTTLWCYYMRLVDNLPKAV